jgi:hypothetical protein
MILHALPREYVVDNQDGIHDPSRHERRPAAGRVNLVTAATSCIQNVVRCVERCELDVADIVLEPLRERRRRPHRRREGDRRCRHRRGWRHERPALCSPTAASRTRA